MRPFSTHSLRRLTAPRAFALALVLLAAATAQALAGGHPETLAEASAPTPPLLELELLRAAETPTEPLRAVRRIVIDPGHGGTNVGALGVAHVHEKHLTLPIAMHLADRLREAHPELEVVLTRHADSELGLAERAAVANRADADLLISVHLNSALNPEAIGVETWWVDDCSPPISASDEHGRLLSLVAALPGLPSVTGARCAAADQARLFAEALHVEYGARVPGVFDRGIKRGGFTVLREAEVPAVVAELGFLSHGEEGLSVLEPGHQARLVEALVRAVERYDAQLAGASAPDLAAVASR